MRERLIELRKHYRMSQRDFCQKLGMTQSTYAPLETGKREIRKAYVKLICQTYNANEEWLKDGTEPMFTESPDLDLNELLRIYDELKPVLKSFLLTQAKELLLLQKDL